MDRYKNLINITTWKTSGSPFDIVRETPSLQVKSKEDVRKALIQELTAALTLAVMKNHIKRIPKDRLLYKRDKEGLHG